MYVPTHGLLLSISPLSPPLTDLTSLADHIANIPLWSNVETAVGLIAGSLPALRQLFVRRRSSRAASNGASNVFHSASGVQVTIGGSGGVSKSRDRKGMRSNFDAVDSDQGQWTRLEEGDNGSDKESTVPIRGIRRDISFEVEMSSLHHNK